MTAPSQAPGATAHALETSVQVALRIRPLVTDVRSLNRGRLRPETEVLSLIERSATPSSVSGSSTPMEAPQQVVVVPLQRHFTFDHIFGTDAAQEEIYQGCVKRMVDKFMEGYNVTIMAYGQTSSGKTYTMGTGAPSAEDRGSTSEGIIPRAMSQLFHEARRPPPVYPGYRVPALKTTFRVSFVEIYNEDLIDLLVKGDFRPPVSIREDAKGNIYWTGVQEIVVSSVEEVIHLLWFGSQNRQTHSTEMNEKSSRSHAIFSITLRQEKFIPTHPPPPQPASSDSQNNSPTFRRAHAKTPSISNTPPPTSSNGGGSASNLLNGRPGTPTTGGSSIPAPFTSGIVAPGSKLKRQSAIPESISSMSLASQVANDDPEVEGEWVTLNSKFHFVDLAGSERLKRTSAIGDRAKEGISINAGLHALGNVISALGDPSKKASHVPYRDSKLTRLLQDSLGGNALALMIACVSPSEVNLGETLNTLKYANRARNIKNSSSLNQEINMDNPEYLRSIIQKLKMEIKVLKAASLNSATSTPRPGITTDAAGTPTAEQPKLPLANRVSTSSSVSTPAPGSLSSVDDIHNEDRALSPSPSRRLSHYQSRDSISTDISHGYLDAVQEEDDGFSDASSSARTTIVGMPTPKAPGDPTTAAAARHNLPPLTIPPSLDSKSFEAFVEPVIEEYEKVISGLETHLAMTQAALNHSELILEEQQGRLDVIEDENRTLLQKQTSLIREASTPSPQQQQLQLELEQALKKVQAQLDDAEARRAESERAIQELESKLAAEQARAQEQIQQLQQEKEQQRAQSTTPTPLLPGLSPAAQEKERELKAQADKIRQLEDQVRILEDQVEAEADALRAAKTAREVSVVDGQDGDETEETKREEELIEKLQSKASMELELEMEKARHESLEAEVKAARKASQQSTNGSLSDHEVSSSQSVVVGEGEDVVRQLDVATHLSTTDLSSAPAIAVAASAGDEQIKRDLEEQLAAARESERQLKEETVALTEKLEKLQKDHAAALEMEEMLHLAVSDLEGRLQTSKETETKQQQELEQHLARIQDLETRSTKAEQEALQVVEELKTKLAEAKVASDERLADELLELLEKMEQERSKVEALQTQVENQLVELAAEKSRVAEIEADRAAIQAQWETDKERISVLEKNIEEHSSHVLEKTALIATLEARLVTLEGSLSEKELLHQELSQKVADHDLVMGSKSTTIQELEDQILSLKSELEVSDKTTKDQVAAVQSELNVAQAQLVDSQTRVQEQEQELLALREKTATLESAAATAAETLASQGAEHAEAVKALESKVKLAEADRDEAETRLEEVERRHNVVDEQIKTLQNDVDLHLATIEILHGKLAQANSGSPPSSRPVSLSSSSTALAAGEDPAPIIQKLEKEKARYRALVRENEKEIERLSEDLESLASEFSNAATAFEDAEEEMKARITELEAIVEGRKPAAGLGASLNNNLSTTSLASSIASSFSARHREGATTNSALHPTSAAAKAQVAALKAERDQALQSSEELSLIVADLNEKNHHLQERLLNLERDQESDKLNHVLERQAQQEEIRMLRERAERLDRNATPSPVGSHHHDDDLRSSSGVLHDRILRHKTSTSSDAFGGAGLRGEDSLATPRQSWSTVASQQQQQQGPPGSQLRAGRHESTLIQQAKHIKLLEERIAELQGSGGSPSLLADSRRGSLSSPAIAQTAGVGLGIQHKSSDADMTRSVSSPMLKRASTEKMSPALRALSTMGGPSAALPPTPPPTAPLPPPPTGGKSTPAHLTGSAPSSPRIGGVFTLETASPGNSPSMRPSRTGSVGRVSNSLRRERDSTSSNLSDANGPTTANNNGGMSPTGSTTSTTTKDNNSAISSATAQALQGVEANELRGVVDTLAHQVQALKVEQTMQQGKIHRLEAALADAEEKLKQARSDVSTTAADRDRLNRELTDLRDELMAAKVKSDKDRAGLETILEKERREREKAVETRAIMEARMEELMGRKSKFGCF
ncbi:hypothetical protein BG015_005479 [Linnemannia schmuckeri]|uniref:Kinesin motor domain-containing protein n=1 Tax=Linnemannia schmuckeri TaxID=64567 RepID=A0A9P5S337_9FUNG|nr:hypothetical protein BG015_005479 [Linnemannia schmuckeri]